MWWGFKGITRLLTVFLCVCVFEWRGTSTEIPIRKFLEWYFEQGTHVLYSKIKLHFLCCLPHPTIFLNDFMSKAKLHYNYRTFWQCHMYVQLRCTFHSHKMASLWPGRQLIVCIVLFNFILQHACVYTLLKNKMVPRIYLKSFRTKNEIRFSFFKNNTQDFIAMFCGLKVFSFSPLRWYKL